MTPTREPRPAGPAGDGAGYVGPDEALTVLEQRVVDLVGLDVRSRADVERELGASPEVAAAIRSLWAGHYLWELGGRLELTPAGEAFIGGRP